MKMLSRDVIRTEIGLTGEKPQGTKEQEQEVTRIFDERMIEYCKKGESFVINNTNVRKEYRSSYLDKCMPYFPRIIYVYCESPDLKVNKERRRRMMPERIIDRMWNDFEFPEPVEYSDGIIAKQKDEND
jgi:predicted kinase